VTVKDVKRVLIPLFEEDVELIETYFLAMRQHKSLTPTAAITETIHNGPRESIRVIQETALQTARYWLRQLVKQYLSSVNNH